MSDPQVIPDEAIERLKREPHRASAFDTVYGPGASASVLGGTTTKEPIAEEGPEKDLTLGGKIWQSTVGAALYGAQEAGNELVDSFESLDVWYGTKMEELGIPGYLGVYTNENGETELGFRHRSEIIESGEDFAFFGQGDVRDDGLELNAIDEPDTVVGQLVGGVSQFAVGYGAVGRVTKLTGLLGSFAKGAAVDALMFDPEDKNITAMVESFGVDSGAFGELLATDPDDPEWANRLRNAAEGALAGAIVEMLAYGVRSRKLARSGRAEEAADAMASAVRASREVEKELASAAKEVQVDAEETVDLSKTLFDDIEVKRTEDGQIDIQPTRKADGTPIRDPDQAEMDLEVPRGQQADPELAPMSPERARWLTPDEVERIRYEARLAKSAPVTEVYKGLPFKGIGQIKSWEDVAPQMAAIRNTILDEWKKTPGNETERWATTKLKSAKAIREMSSLMGEDPRKLIERFNKGVESKEELAAEMVARSAVVKSILRETDAMAEAISKGTLDEARWPGYRDMDQFKIDYNKKMSIASAISRENAASRSELGRALNALKIDKADDAQLKKVMADPTLQGDIEAMAKAHVEARQQGAPVLSAVEKAQKAVRKFLDGVNSYRINALLSGPGTQEVNFISNLINTVAIPTQQIIGGAASFDAAAVRHGIRTIQGMVAGAFDSVDAALKTLYEDEAFLDPFRGKLEEDMIGAGSNNILGKTMRLPSRALMGMDEFFKQSAYRGVIFADASAMAKKANLKGDEKVKFIKGYIADSFDENGMAKRGDALLQAQRSTFTEALDQGTLPYNIQQIAMKYPIARFIVPFVRTPINILNTAYQHVPVAGALSKRWQADFAAGGARRAQAIGKMGIGTSLIVMAASHVAQGNITGGGPTDPRIRKVWLKNNNPYSFRIEQEDGTVRWVSYARYEPMAQLFAIMADYAEIMNDRYNENAGRGDAGVLGALFMATMENSVNKTFTQGVYDAMKILADPSPSSRERALNNMIASFVPNVMNQMNGDPAYREARTLVDAMWARGPDYEAVDPKRNVLGEVVYRSLPKVDPLAAIYKDEREVDTVMKEITRVALINQTVAGNPNKVIPAPQEPGGRLDLTQVPYSEGQSLYDKWVEYTGEIELNGRTLREQLEKTFKSSSYQKAPDGFEGSSGNTKSSIIKKIISTYRQAAKRDIPELVDVLKASKRGEAQFLREQANKNRNLLPKSKTDIERQMLRPRTFDDILNSRRQ